MLLIGMCTSLTKKPTKPVCVMCLCRGDGVAACVSRDVSRRRRRGPGPVRGGMNARSGRTLAALARQAGASRYNTHF